MEILYKKDDFIIPNNINEKKYYTKEGGGGTIYILENENKKLILKIFENNKRLEFEKEKYGFFLIKEKNEDKFVNDFIIDYLAIIKYEEQYIFFMKKLDYLINDSFLESITVTEQKNILSQILISIYILNNNYSIYFNDLFQDVRLKNIMVKKNIKKKNIFY